MCIVSKEKLFKRIWQKYVNVKLQLVNDDIELDELQRVLKMSIERNSFILEDLGTTTAELKKVLKVIDSLVKENLLCHVEDGSYRLHSTLVASFISDISAVVH